MGYTATMSQSVLYADESTRVAYLRRVATWTAMGLAIAGVSGAVSAVTIAPLIAGSMIGQMALMFGGMWVAQRTAREMVWNGNANTGFVLGNAAMGAAMGMILLAAAMQAARYGESPFAVIGQAGGYTLITAFSMCAYLWSGPKNLSMVRSILSVAFFPMLILMVVSFVFPIGGVFGIGISLLFVGISACSLVYSLNQVLHQVQSHQHVQGAYELSLGLIVLFWNILVLLMRSRD